MASASVTSPPKSMIGMLFLRSPMRPKARSEDMQDFMPPGLNLEFRTIDLSPTSPTTARRLSQASGRGIVASKQNERDLKVKKIKKIKKIDFSTKDPLAAELENVTTAAELKNVFEQLIGRLNRLESKMKEIESTFESKIAELHTFNPVLYAGLGSSRLIAMCDLVEFCYVFIDHYFKRTIQTWINNGNDLRTLPFQSEAFAHVSYRAGITFLQQHKRQQQQQQQLKDVKLLMHKAEQLFLTTEGFDGVGTSALRSLFEQYFSKVKMHINSSAHVFPCLTSLIKPKPYYQDVHLRFDYLNVETVEDDYLVLLLKVLKDIRQSLGQTQTTPVLLNCLPKSVLLHLCDFSERHINAPKPKRTRHSDYTKQSQPKRKRARH